MYCLRFRYRRLGKNANEFDIAPAYSYLWLRLRYSVSA